MVPGTHPGRLPTTGNASPWGPNALSVPPWAPALSSTYPHRGTELQINRKPLKEVPGSRVFASSIMVWRRSHPHGPMNAVSRVGHTCALVVTLHLHISTNVVPGGSWPQLFNGTSSDFHVNIIHKALTSHSLSGTQYVLIICKHNVTPGCSSTQCHYPLSIPAKKTNWQQKKKGDLIRKKTSLCSGI